MNVNTCLAEWIFVMNMLDISIYWTIVLIAKYIVAAASTLIYLEHTQLALECHIRLYMREGSPCTIKSQAYRVFLVDFTVKRTLLDRSVCALVQLTKLYEVNISLNEFNTLTPRHLTNEKGGFSHMTFQFSSFKFHQTLAISDTINNMLQNDRCKVRC